jgi:hypothetical protein
MNDLKSTFGYSSVYQRCYPVSLTRKASLCSIGTLDGTGQKRLNILLNKNRFDQIKNIATLNKILDGTGQKSLDVLIINNFIRLKT